MNPYSYIMNNPLAGTDPSGYASCGEVECDFIIRCGANDPPGCDSDIPEGDKDRDGEKSGGNNPPPDNGKNPEVKGEIPSDIGSPDSQRKSRVDPFVTTITDRENIENFLRGAASTVVSMIPFGESAQMAMRGNWSGAFQSAGIEAGMMAAGALTGGLAYGAYKAYKAGKAAKALEKVVTGGTKRSKSPCPLSCFVAGTEVLTKVGYKKIEDIKEGEVVWAKNVETGESDWKPVTHTWIVENKDIYRVSIVGEDGKLQTIDATASHPFYVERKGWINTVDLVQGDILLDKEEGSLKVVSIVDEQRKDTVYNFTVADFHTYYVTERNILVHNCDVTKKVDTPHTVNTGGKAPKTSEPNSIIESRRADGSSSTTYYDDKGRAFSREDYGQQSTHGSLGRRADGRSTAHEHRFDYNERGFPVKQDVYRPLSESGSPAGPWVGK